MVEDVHKVVARTWDVTGALPVLVRPILCPFCHGPCPDAMMHAKSWRFHKRETGSKTPYRCDVVLKCHSCGYVASFGVVVPRESYDAAVEANGHAPMVNHRQSAPIFAAGNTWPCRA